MAKQKFVLTGDDSHSLFVPELNEHYHSKYGAIQESVHVFLEAGLRHKGKKNSSLKVLEIGLGTGLNALLTLQECVQQKKKVYYTALEKYPLEKPIYERLNYRQLLSDHEDYLGQLHEASWERKVILHDYFSLLKVKVDVQSFKPLEKVDLIYYDAFAPRVQPQLWTEAIFRQMYDALNEGGSLVTYCAKGSVRRNMKSVGFHVEKLPGPLGKREMLRATK